MNRNSPTQRTFENVRRSLHNTDRRLAHLMGHNPLKGMGDPGGAWGYAL